MVYNQAIDGIVLIVLMGMKKCSSQRKPAALPCKRKTTSGVLKICKLSPSVISNVIVPPWNHFHTFCMISTFLNKKKTNYCMQRLHHHVFHGMLALCANGLIHHLQNTQTNEFTEYPIIL